MKKDLSVKDLLILLVITIVCIFIGILFSGLFSFIISGAIWGVLFLICTICGITVVPFYWIWIGVFVLMMLSFIIGNSKK